MSVIPHSVHVQEVTQREHRIAMLEAELDRKSNLVTAYADALARANSVLLSVGRVPYQVRVR